MMLLEFFDLLAITIDEYLTSRICNNYSYDTVEALKALLGQSILACKTCSVLWSRCVNTA
ncbi:hypothetical protein BDF20DRAFT_851816 [Mycotypha africana]|uniref:uncharacterized protein n=1 Tax=Mycotypha africana TaxID=64632 RepID=UPI00230006CE|nr:uncharacterized protein BDF20DRAFT_851816 [Mycotypha africana]KAI8987711.1 hypothetical protein BDF20DRAFT_851816 [Mycotypha africana]